MLFRFCKTIETNNFLVYWYLFELILLEIHTYGSISFVFSRNFNIEYNKPFLLSTLL